ncbi:MAG: DUF1569 domain-containing protein [Flavobacterium sp.]|uniref:DUF1569 domain-containing protein n=1 Tax=Flavobacterium sp. TaxID=239 RepID=UPI003262F07F
MVDIFNEEGANEFIDRINKLKENMLPFWGKMNSAQMLSHCNMVYVYVFEIDKLRRPNFLKLLWLKLFWKKYMVSEKPYEKNSPTAPEFIIVGYTDFEKEKLELISYIQMTQRLGENYFEGLKNYAFGKLSAKEWSNLFSKHLDHHLKQFGV